MASVVPKRGIRHDVKVHRSKWLDPLLQPLCRLIDHQRSQFSWKEWFFLRRSAWVPCRSRTVDSCSQQSEWKVGPSIQHAKQQKQSKRSTLWGRVCQRQEGRSGVCVDEMRRIQASHEMLLGVEIFVTRMHRQGWLTHQPYKVKRQITAKVRVYRMPVSWRAQATWPTQNFAKLVKRNGRGHLRVLPVSSQ